MNTVFNEEIEIKKDILTITVTCEKRRSVYDKKFRYEKDIKLLIPEHLKVKLLEKPALVVSNLLDENHTNVGIWKFKIIPERKKTSRPQSTTKRRTRKHTPKGRE
tara:strand:+ start:103 stop:417 length:315 start_codon:yes stop_codon:yes gene_type:complete